MNPCIKYPQNLAPENTVIAFDLHGVIFSSSIRQILTIVWHCPNKLRFLKLITNIRLARTVVNGVFKKYVIEQLIQELSHKHPLFDQFKDTALAVANAQKVNQKTFVLLKDLHAKNYQLVAFSNIGEQSIKILSTRHPEVFDLFSHVIYTSAQDNFVAKPHPQAFDKLFVCITPTEKNIVFIDDSSKNIKQAHALGIYPITFSSARSLKQALKQLKIVG